MTEDKVKKEMLEAMIGALEPLTTEQILVVWGLLVDVLQALVRQTKPKTTELKTKIVMN